MSTWLFYGSNTFDFRKIVASTWELSKFHQLLLESYHIDRSQLSTSWESWQTATIWHLRHVEKAPWRNGETRHLDHVVIQKVHKERFLQREVPSQLEWMPRNSQTHHRPWGLWERWPQSRQQGPPEISPLAVAELSAGNWQMPSDWM